MEVNYNRSAPRPIDERDSSCNGACLFTSLINFVNARSDNVWDVFFFCARILQMQLEVHSKCCHTPLDLLKFPTKTKNI